ncbi:MULTISPECIES: ATP-binding cassette domain-containing protein [Niastella]|uniref:ATP-binding cassette domain-containing protein n=1 Tax=Niastella soli TaxID=2821487 RepID=A0ABS3Z127_9BACT|nr:ATP-binding cassette domain-containing protein [Niastella soli]MBO9203865.1 ATP-binding cassette domain-containing protein [Niastella soli]
MSNAIVQIDQLSYSFHNQKALDDISMQIPAGSIYGFLGPNGAGKTTTLRLLLGLLKDQKGLISIFGSNLMTNRTGLLKRIGSLIEQPSLYQHLTGAENLEVFRLTYQVTRKRVDEVLKIVGLTDARHKKVRAYSLGMKQRLAIALSLLHDPELLILDEPTNGLDPGGIIEMRELIITLNRQYGKTILVSSHLLHEIEKTATQVGIIHKGRMLFEGTLTDLQQIKASRSVIEMEINDVTAAMELLANQFSVKTVEGKIIVDFVSSQHTAKLNALLVQHGIEVYQICVTRHNLEDLFVHITSE